MELERGNVVPFRRSTESTALERSHTLGQPGEVAFLGLNSELFMEPSANAIEDLHEHHYHFNQGTFEQVAGSAVKQYTDQLKEPYEIPYALFIWRSAYAAALRGDTTESINAIAAQLYDSARADLAREAAKLEARIAAEEAEISSWAEVIRLPREG